MSDQSKKQEKPRVTGTATMTVICKIPQGIMIQRHEKRRITEVTLGGSREVDQFFPVGEAFYIKGPAHAQNEGPRCRIASGFALTEDVPEDLWREWYEQTGKYLPACQNGLLQAFSNSDRAVSAAKEVKKERTGLERLNPNKLPTLDPRFKLKTADEQVAEIVYPIEE